MMVVVTSLSRPRASAYNINLPKMRCAKASKAAVRSTRLAPETSFINLVVWLGRGPTTIGWHSNSIQDGIFMSLMERFIQLQISPFLPHQRKVMLNGATTELGVVFTLMVTLHRTSVEIGKPRYT